MSAPVDEAGALGGGTGSGTAYAVDLSGLGTISAGEVLVALLFDENLTQTWTPPSGWVEILDSGGITVACRLCDGTEGASVNFTGSGSNQTYAWGVSRWTNAAKATTVAAAGGTSTTPDPPTHTPTPAVGALTYGWIATGVIGGNQDPSAYPSGYANTNSSQAPPNTSIARASRTNSATSENPGTYTYPTSLLWRSLTIAVWPADEVFVRGVGASASGTTSMTTNAPTGADVPQIGDAKYIVMESSDSTTAAGTPATPSGWDKLFEETTDDGNTGVTTLTIFGRIHQSGDGNVSITGVGNHCQGRMYAIGGHGLSAITDTVVGTGSGALTGNGTFNAITVEANSLVLQCIASSRDANSTAQFSGWASTNGTDETELADNTVTSGAGGGTGVAATRVAGTDSGSGSVTLATSEEWRAVQIGIPPPSGAAAFTPQIIHHVQS